MNSLNTLSYLNVIPLSSYNVLIGMEWLTTHQAILDCYNKTCTCLYVEGNKVTIKGIYRPIYLRHRYNLTIKEVF